MSLYNSGIPGLLQLVAVILVQVVQECIWFHPEMMRMMRMRMMSMKWTWPL